ncbi:MAG: DUF72 domain-containing protein [Candidatus Shapirobacteria bacterium]|jgi:hypothetical protein
MPDVRFGVAVQDGWGEFPGALPSYPELGTVELPFDLWARGGIQVSGDLCLRLGEAFILPARERTADGGLAANGEAAYRAAIAAVKEGQAGKMPLPSAFLLEFPAAITHSAAARRHLDRVVKDLEGLPLAVAFHGADWYSARVIEGLKARGAALCLLDGAREPGLPPSIDVVTSSLVYIKLRDRTDPSAWLTRIEALAAQAETVRVIFSDSGRGGAAEKATLMARLWQGRANGDSLKGGG